MQLLDGGVQMTLVYDHKYITRDNGRGRHIWSVAGEAGGVHIWAEDTPKSPFNQGERFFGGVEVHSKAPMYDGQPVGHNHCWLTDGPCYHDGTSLYFAEKIEPMLQSVDGGSVPEHLTEYLNFELLDWYRARLDKGECK